MISLRIKGNLSGCHSEQADRGIAPHLRRHGRSETSTSSSLEPSSAVSPRLLFTSSCCFSGCLGVAGGHWRPVARAPLQPTELTFAFSSLLPLSRLPASPHRPNRCHRTSFPRLARSRGRSRFLAYAREARLTFRVRSPDFQESGYQARLHHRADGDCLAGSLRCAHRHRPVVPGM